MKIVLVLSYFKRMVSLSRMIIKYSIINIKGFNQIFSISHILYQNYFKIILIFRLSIINSAIIILHNINIDVRFTRVKFNI